LAAKVHSVKDPSFRLGRTEKGQVKLFPSVAGPKGTGRTCMPSPRIWMPKREKKGGRCKRGKKKILLRRGGFYVSPSRGVLKRAGNLLNLAFHGGKREIEGLTTSRFRGEKTVKGEGPEIIIGTPGGGGRPRKRMGRFSSRE